MLGDRAIDVADTQDPISAVVTLLKEGHIVAIKGLGGFHLAVDAENEQAVTRLRQRKHREEKPLAVMAYDIDHVRRFAHLVNESDGFADVGRQRQALGAVALAVNDKLTSAPIDVVELKCGNLPRTQPETDERDQDRKIAPPLSCAAIT